MDDWIKCKGECPFYCDMVIQVKFGDKIMPPLKASSWGWPYLVENAAEFMVVENKACSSECRCRHKLVEMCAIDCDRMTDSIKHHD